MQNKEETEQKIIKLEIPLNNLIDIEETFYYQDKNKRDNQENKEEFKDKKDKDI